MPNFRHVDIVGGTLIMAYVSANEIVFDDLPEYLEDENTPAANRVAAWRDEWDGLTVDEIINLPMEF